MPTNETGVSYHAVLETDPETGHITGTVLGLPEIIVDAMDEQQVLEDLRIAIEMASEDPLIPVRPLPRIVML